MQEYKQWRVGQIAVGERWNQMRKTIATDLSNKTQIAKSIANGYMPQVYAVNANYAAFEVEKAAKVETSFTLYSKQSAERLLKDNPQVLQPPGKRMLQKIRTGKAVKWQEGQIQSVVIQALLQGESIPNMATRIASTLCVKDRKAAFRYARTSTTEAENAGRMDSYYRASDMGIKIKKTWVASLDDRTRDWHRELDGQTVPIDQPFENEFGQIDHPGDPSADPANVWNCRCTIITQIEGFERDPEDLGLRRNNKLGDMSYDEWKEEHGESQDILEPDRVAERMRRIYAREYRR